MIEWKDGTTYYRNAPRIQTAWEAKVGPLRLWMGTEHVYNKGKWMAHAHPLFSERPLDAAPDDVEGAKAELIAAVREWMGRVTAVLEQGGSK